MIRLKFQKNIFNLNLLLILTCIRILIDRDLQSNIVAIGDYVLSLGGLNENRKVLLKDLGFEEIDFLRCVACGVEMSLTVFENKGLPVKNLRHIRY